MMQVKEKVEGNMTKGKKGRRCYSEEMRGERKR
jgi:hypothetical protein